MKKSELLLNPYKEHLKKPYLHGAGTLEINGVQYSADEYITMLEEENKNLREENQTLTKCNLNLQEHTDKVEKENKNMRERIDILYEFIERNDELVDKVIDEEDFDKLNRYIYIDDDLVDRALESEN